MIKLAFTLGNNHFTNYPRDTLGGCIPDSQSTAQVFDDMGCAVEMAHDAADYTVLNKLQDIYKKVVNTPSYYVGLWFSSHGSHYPSASEPDGLGEGLCCTNLIAQGDDWSAGFIKDKSFRNILNRFPLQGIVEIGFDTCFSGGMDRIVSASQQPRFLHNPGNLEGLLRIANSGFSSQGLNSNIVMWQACSEAQTSADAYIKSGYHGAFTYYWTEQFRVNPGISRVELLLKVRAALKANHFEQFPRLKCWNAAAQRKVGK